MQKSTRIPSNPNQKDLKPQNTAIIEENKEPPYSKKNEKGKTNQNSKPSPTKIKPPEKKDPEPIKYENNFSQESQNPELMEKRVDLIIEEAVSMENEYGRMENEEDFNFEERMTTLTTKLQHIFENFSNKQDELEVWFRDTLSGQIQAGLEKINLGFQSLENVVKERKELQNQTSQALGLAVYVQKVLKENQKLWAIN